MSNEISSKDEILKQVKSKANLENIKSDYMLKNLFNIMKKNISFKIVKYNKKLQKRLNLNFNSYKDYSQLYSPIEIEIKIWENQYDKYNIFEQSNKKNMFINKLDEVKEFYHIYFDNSNEEIKKSYLNDNEKVNTIKIIIDHQVKSFKKLFYYCENVYSIFFKKFTRTNITDMSFMFHGCSSLNKLNIPCFNTNNVTDMSFMFNRCFSISGLNVSRFNTSNVTNMEGMFGQCPFRLMNLSNFNTSNVTNMNGMFYGCFNLIKLNLSNFNTDKVTNMQNMFSECKS